MAPTVSFAVFFFLSLPFPIFRRDCRVFRVMLPYIFCQLLGECKWLFTLVWEEKLSLTLSNRLNKWSIWHSSHVLYPYPTRRNNNQSWRWMPFAVHSDWSLISLSIVKQNLCTCQVAKNPISFYVHEINGAAILFLPWLSSFFLSPHTH